MRTSKRPRARCPPTHGDSVAHHSSPSNVLSFAASDKPDAAATTRRPTKRTRSRHHPAEVTLEGALSEETLLLCLSFLDVEDLLVLARVSSSWNRLTKDPELWRRLYLATFPSAASRSTSISPLGGRTRPWRSLFIISTNWRRGNARPSTLSSSVRQSVLAEAPTDFALAGEPIQPSVSPPSLPSRRTPRSTLDTILQFHNSYYFTATRKATSSNPPVLVYQTNPSGASVLVGTITSPSIESYYAARPHLKFNFAISELRLDDRPTESFANPSLRLAVFYSTGQSAIYDIRLPTSTTSLIPTEMFSFLPLPLSSTFISSTPPSPSAFDPVVLARFHSPLLVTCSASFKLSFYRVFSAKSPDLEGKSTKLSVEEAKLGMQSHESWWPVVLTLAPLKEPIQTEDLNEEVTEEWGRTTPLPEKREEIFKVTLAYSTPVFPSAWSVGVQEFVVKAPSFDSAPTITSYSTHRHPRMSIIARHATAPRAHSTAVLNSRNFWNPSHDDGLVTSIEHADRWIVTSRKDNTIDVYEVVDAGFDSPGSLQTGPNTIRTSTALSTTTLSIVHRRTLFGHTASVSSVAVDDEGRCVSGGVDGRVRVWDVGGSKEVGMGLQITEKREQGEEDEENDDMSWEDIRTGVSRKGSSNRMIKRVFFDEKKIVTIVEGGEGSLRSSDEESVRVLRFD